MIFAYMIQDRYQKPRICTLKYLDNHVKGFSLLPSNDFNEADYHDFMAMLRKQGERICSHEYRCKSGYQGELTVKKVRVDNAFVF